MSNDTDLIKKELWESLQNKARRDAFVASHISDNTGAQIFALRESRGWSQEKLASETGMAQPRICILEGGYENYSLRTLKRIASAFDVALIVRFVPFSELVDWAASISEGKLAPVSFANDNLSEGKGDRDDARTNNALVARHPSYASAIDGPFSSYAKGSERSIYKFYSSMAVPQSSPTAEAAPTVVLETKFTPIEKMFSTSSANPIGAERF